MKNEHDIMGTLLLNWAKTTFGPVALDPPERAARVVEEAVEVAQCLGVSKDILHRIVDRTYARPVGDLFNELGAVLLCTYSLCALIESNPMELLFREANRVTLRNPEHWKAKHDAKVADGTADVSTLADTKQARGDNKL